MCKLSVIFFIVCFFQKTLAQVNGDFWWLHKETENINGKKIPVPKFENVTSLENDEYDKVLFIKRPKHQDPREKKERNNEKSKSWTVHFPNWNDFISASLYHDNEIELNATVIVNKNLTEPLDQDLFTFNFPEDIERKFWSLNDSSSATAASASNSSLLNSTTTKPSTKFVPKIHEANKNLTDKHKLIFRVDVNYNTKSESICTFVEKEECLNRNGHVYKYLKRFSPKDKALVCCILPLKESPKMQKSQYERIVFPDYSEKHSDKVRKTRDIHQKSSIVTPDDDNEDPYANIRNHRVTTHKISFRYTTTPVTNYDYLDEVPMPGLLGYYNAGESDESDYWPSEDSSEISEEGGSLEQGYGGSTINQRLGDGFGTANPKVTLNRYATMSTDRLTVRVANINYHSDPDFQVLKGYKLLNLVSNSSNQYPKLKTAITTSKRDDYSDEDIDSSGRHNYNCDYGDYSEDYAYGRQSGASTNRLPWMGIVSRNLNTRKTFCYATLIHPKAAITGGSCIYGLQHGEVTFYIGTKRYLQRRTPTTRLLKTSGSFVENIAILYWSQPLKVNADINPVCLDNPEVGETCLFQPWNLRDRDAKLQGQRRRRLLAVFLKTKDCTNIPKAFCAFLKGDGFVFTLIYNKHEYSEKFTECLIICATDSDYLLPYSQTGGALVCNRQGRQVAVGVMTQQSSLQHLPPSKIIVLPIQQWALNQLRTLGLV